MTSEPESKRERKETAQDDDSLKLKLTRVDVLPSTPVGLKSLHLNQCSVSSITVLLDFLASDVGNLLEVFAISQSFRCPGDPADGRKVTMQHLKELTITAESYRPLFLKNVDCPAIADVTLLCVYSQYLREFLGRHNRSISHLTLTWYNNETDLSGDFQLEMPSLLTLRLRRDAGWDWESESDEHPEYLVIPIAPHLKSIISETPTPCMRLPMDCSDIPFPTIESAKDSLEILHCRMAATESTLHFPKLKGYSITDWGMESGSGPVSSIFTHPPPMFLFICVSDHMSKKLRWMKSYIDLQENLTGCIWRDWFGGVDREDCFSHDGFGPLQCWDIVSADCQDFSGKTNPPKLPPHDADLPLLMRKQFEIFNGPAEFRTAQIVRMSGNSPPPNFANAPTGFFAPTVQFAQPCIHQLATHMGFDKLDLDALSEILGSFDGQSELLFLQSYNKFEGTPESLQIILDRCPKLERLEVPRGVQDWVVDALRVRGLEEERGSGRGNRCFVRKCDDGEEEKAWKDFVMVASKGFCETNLVVTVRAANYNVNGKESAAKMNSEFRKSAHYDRHSFSVDSEGTWTNPRVPYPELEVNGFFGTMGKYDDYIVGEADQSGVFAWDARFSGCNHWWASTKRSE